MWYIGSPQAPLSLPKPVVKFSEIFAGYSVGSLKWDIMRIFIPWKSANATNRTPFPLGVSF